MAGEFSIFTPGPEHPWGDLTRQLICRDVRKWTAEDIADGWSESAFEVLNMASERSTVEYHALGEAGELLAVGSLVKDPQSNPPSLFLDTLVVPPEYRGQGYGSKMLRRLELRAQELGTRCLSLNAIKSSVSFYQHNGYRCTNGSSMVKQLDQYKD